MGTRSRQCRPKVPGRFAFPGARNPRICSMSPFGKTFPAIFRGLSLSFPPEPPEQNPETATAFSRFLIEALQYSYEVVVPPLVSSKGLARPEKLFKPRDLELRISGGICPKLLATLLGMHLYHLSQKYCITVPYVWTINFGRRNVKTTS